MPSTPTSTAGDAFRKRLLQWTQDNLRSFPWRDDVSPYEVLAPEILLTQTPAPRVAGVYPEFIDRYPSSESLAPADLRETTALLEPLRFKNRCADALQSIGERLSNRGVPRELEALTDLPYVGRYGANATLCFGFGGERLIVEANVVHIFNRVFDTGFGDAEDSEAWRFAKYMFPNGDVSTYNLALVDSGSEVCTAQTPACSGCPMNGFCDYYNENVS